MKVPLRAREVLLATAVTLTNKSATIRQPNELTDGGCLACCASLTVQVRFFLPCSLLYHGERLSYPIAIQQALLLLVLPSSELESKV